MVTPKLTKSDASLGVNRLRELETKGRLSTHRASGDGAIASADQDFDRHMEIARKVMKRRRSVLRALAD
jgi:hypothetical protein